MLEIKNLTKIYKTKKNVITRALDDVSLKFPDRGMVFLLGKSGSGKSTLLNICGGLDFPTSGEVIVKGKSSKSFTKSDFDSYRNTYIGFIFQEYNVLEELTVEANITLALELQGKSKNQEELQKILTSVEMEEFGSRKPNTLSGGQKQRVAIARALVKNPEIIMADEPTGALDSETGKQVLMLLKKLSKEKLVIVVSHDREFAEEYGDRIIELKDGKVLSDTSKTLNKTLAEDSLSFVDEQTILIQEGASLTLDDLEKINKFISKNQKIIISTSGKYLQDYGYSNTTFSQTNQAQIPIKEYGPNDTKFIKSHLPLKHSFKMALSSLKIKPIRLIFTVLLSITAFVFLGMMSTLMFYDKYRVAEESINKLDNPYIYVQKEYEMAFVLDGKEQYKERYVTNIGDVDKEEIIKKYGEEVIFCYNYDQVQVIGDELDDSKIMIANLKNIFEGSGIYTSYALNFATCASDHPILESIVGTYPKSSNEIMISSFIFDFIKKSQLVDFYTQDIYNLTNYESIIGKELVLTNINSSSSYKVTGVYITQDLTPEKYADFGNDSNEELTLWQHYKESIYGLVLVSDDFYEANKSVFGTNSYTSGEKFNLYSSELGGTYYDDLMLSSDDMVVYYDKGQEYIGKYEEKLILPLSMYAHYIVNYTKLYEIPALLDKYENTLIGSESIENWHSKIIEEQGTIEERHNAWLLIYDFFEENNLLYDFTTVTFEDSWDEISLTIDLIGYTLIDGNLPIVDDVTFDALKATYYNQVTKYQIDKEAKYSGCFIPNNHQNAKKIVDDMYILKDDDTLLNVHMAIISSLKLTDEIIVIFAKVFLWAGIAYAVFATLLLFNFISVSIVNKMKEIGILRAVGARGLDIFKIFFIEALMITTICFIISIVSCSLLCLILNVQIGKSLFDVRLFVFGIKSISLILGISIMVAVLSTFIPVYRIARKKPVESIKAL